MSAQRLSFHLRASLCKVPPLNTLSDYWQFSVIQSCQTEYLHSSLDIGWRLPSPLTTWASPCSSLLYQSMKAKEATQSASKIEITVLCKLIMDVTLTSHYLCHILLFIGTSLRLTNTQGRGNYRRMWIQEAGITGDRLASLPTIFILLEYGWEDYAQQNISSIISIWNKAM